MIRFAANAFAAIAAIAASSTWAQDTSIRSPDPLADEVRVPLGDVAGDPGGRGALIPNPEMDNADAVNRGRKLFVRMNCAGCHGYDAKGGMGPNLADRYWRYGGSPVQIYESIIEGRPQGMPSWSEAIPGREVWDIVAYVQSLGGAATVEEGAAQREGDQPGELKAPEMSEKP